MPLNDAGRICDPPVCVPNANGTWKSPTAAPDPDDDPNERGREIHQRVAGAVEAGDDGDDEEGRAEEFGEQACST